MTAFSQSLLQQLDVNGSPLSGWSVKFFQSGSVATPVTVWKDVACTSPHAIPVRADGQGRMPTLYYTKNGIKLRAEITFPDGRVKVIDDIDPGTSTDAITEEEDPRLPSVSHTGLTVTLTATDVGKMHAIPTTLGTATAVLLPRASTLKDGQIIGIQNSGAGTVIYRTQGTDLLNNRKSLLLTEQDAFVLVRCTGAGFERISETNRSATRYVVTSNSVATPPVSAAAGVTYLAPETSTDAWAPNSIYQADGVGGWIGHAPVIGDEAVVTSKTTTISGGVQIPLRLLWNGSAWVDQSQFASQNRFVVQSATTAIPPTGSPVGTMYLAPAGASGGWTAGNIYTSDGANGWVSHTPVIGDEVVTRDATTIIGSTTVPTRYFYYNGTWLDESVFASKAAAFHLRGEFSSGTGSNSAYSLASAAPAVNVWTQVLLNTTVLNSISGASVAGNVVTLPNGTYRITAKHKMKGAISARLRFVSTSTITELKGMAQSIIASTAGVVDVEGQISVTLASESFQLMFILAGTAAASTLGDAASISGESEVYGELFIAAV